MALQSSIKTMHVRLPPSCSTLIRPPTIPRASTGRWPRQSRNNTNARRAISLSSIWNGSKSSDASIASGQAVATTSQPSKPSDSNDTIKPQTSTTTQLETSASGMKKKKTMAELDEELRLKMSGLAGDGGEAGVEYEDGEPVAMKRSVKNNMFRYI